MLVASDTDELSEVLLENTTAANTTNNVYLAIQPTALCQLGCHYCGQRHTNKQVSRADEAAIVSRVRDKFRDPRFKALDVSWFGAEPLLALDQIDRLSGSLMELCRISNVRYSAKCVTNGVKLTADVFNQLRALKVGYFEVTLDGAEAWHDSRRAHKGGQPSFAIILDNLRSIFSLDDYAGEIGLRCNVDLTNQAGVVPLLDQLRTEGMHSKFSKVYFAPIHSWGNDAHLATGSLEEFSAREVQWTVEAIKRGFKVGLIPDRKPIVCMAVRPEAELVDAFGTLFNCSEVSYVPAYEVKPETTGASPNPWAIGHLTTGETYGSREKLGNFNSQVQAKTVPCGDCEILPICGGSCPKMWMEGLRACPTAKYNIGSRLALEHLLGTRKLEALQTLQEG